MSILIEPQFHLGETPNPVFCLMAGLRASRQLNPDLDKIFQFLETKYFPDLGVINPAANGFKLGVLENVHARPASFTAPYTQMKQRFTRI